MFNGACCMLVCVPLIARWPLTAHNETFAIMPRISALPGQEGGGDRAHLPLKYRQFLTSFCCQMFCFSTPKKLCLSRIVQQTFRLCYKIFISLWNLSRRWLLTVVSMTTATVQHGWKNTSIVDILKKLRLRLRFDVFVFTLCSKNHET